MELFIFQYSLATIIGAIAITLPLKIILMVKDRVLGLTNKIRF